MTFRELMIEIMKITADPKIPQDAEVWIEGEGKRSVRIFGFRYYRRRKRIYITRKKQGNQHSLPAEETIQNENEEQEEG